MAPASLTNSAGPRRGEDIALPLAAEPVVFAPEGEKTFSGIRIGGAYSAPERSWSRRPA
jgi:hypothetical protein